MRLLWRRLGAGTPGGSGDNGGGWHSRWRWRCAVVSLSPQDSQEDAAVMTTSVVTLPDDCGNDREVVAHGHGDDLRVDGCP